MKVSSMNYLFSQGVKNIWTNRIMSVASYCILVVALLLSGFTLLFIENINLIVGGVEDKNEVVIFLNDDLPEQAVQSVGVTLENLNNVSSVDFRSKEDGFAEIKKNMTDAENLLNYIGDESPLPDSYLVKIADITNISPTLMEINAIDGIASVNAPNDFVSILTGVKSLISIFSITILAALVIVSLVIISNAARASVEMRKRDIAIMKLVGATNGFIKTPFFVEGMTIGILAGISAFLITYFGYNSLTETLMEDSTTWTIVGIKGFLSLDGILIKMIATYILVGAIISGFGTVLSTRKHVKI